MTASTIQTFHGILFDMDGTIIDSTDAVVQFWTAIAHEIGVDPSLVLAASHGHRTIDTIKLFDPSRADWDYVRDLEFRLPLRYGGSVKEVPGARKALERLGSTPWGLVTSASRALALNWFQTMDLPRPKVLVGAEDVLRGKPDPTCYALGREKLRLPADAKVLVVEDAPAGIQAGKAAGCQVLGLATSHAVEKVRTNQPEWIVKDLTDLKILQWDETKKLVEVEITNVLIK